VSTQNTFDHLGDALPARRSAWGPGWLVRTAAGAARFLTRTRGATQRRMEQDLSAVREELFHIRGELALLRARSGYGRRDVFALAELLRLGNRREVKAIIREHCQPVPMPDGTLLCRVLARYKMQLDGRDGGLASHLLLDGFWEWWITEFVCRNLERGEVALDVGACYGYYTMVFADLVGAEGRVYAFEPNPTAHALLARNIALNGLAPHVTAHAVAVAEGGGRAVGLRVPPTDPQSAARAAG
jgi:hypothetical protein